MRPVGNEKRLMVVWCLMAIAFAPPGVWADDPGSRPVDALTPTGPGMVQLRGWVGDSLDACIQHRIWGMEVEKFVAILRNRNDHGNWRGEYWGKWYTAAALAQTYNPAENRRARLIEIARDVANAQEADGYLGPYESQQRLTNWDIWCRKYVQLGLIAAYDLTGDKTLLDAARQNADNLIDDIAQKKLKLVEIGIEVLQGVADSSIIEPMALLHQRTGDRKYLDFAESIIAQWNEPYRSAPQGIHLLENALVEKPLLRNHSYAIMSCFEGICELYRCTGNRQYLDGAVRFANSVRRHERMIDGGVSNQELFFDGAKNQTEIMEQPQETCATVTWIKLCNQLLRLTGDPVWADELEISLYNAMLGALTPRGEFFCYFTALTGERVPSFIPHPELNMSCCLASGPRGVLLTPQWAVMAAQDGPVVNLYGPSAATVELRSGERVKIDQDTHYPFEDRVKLTLSLDHPCRFTLALRIPAWSRQTLLSVNGESVPCEPGKYARLARQWSPGDEIILQLDLRGRAIAAPSGAPQMAVMRGPIVLAVDNRLIKPQDIAAHLMADAEGYVDLKPTASKPGWARLVCDVPFRIRPSHFFDHHTIQLSLCDFASAGNEWSETNLYRVWLPQPMFLSHVFVANTWKFNPPLPGPGRPTIPAALQAK